MPKRTAEATRLSTFIVKAPSLGKNTLPHVVRLANVLIAPRTSSRLTSQSGIAFLLFGVIVRLEFLNSPLRTNAFLCYDIKLPLPSFFMNSKLPIHSNATAPSTGGIAIPQPTKIR